MQTGKIELAGRNKCTSCSACADICPKQCISFDSFGTLQKFPKIDEDVCIKCGLCVRTCPELNPITQSEDEYSRECYAAWCNDDTTRATSTSGGIGTAIAQWAISEGFAVCGALFDSNWNLKHQVSKELSDIRKFSQSKYLQSSTNGVLREIIGRLKNGEKILFIGTPCQVAGLVKMCPAHNRQNLLTVDIICHGVNSPMVWKDYLNYLQKTNNSKLVAYNFRDKSHGWERKNGTPNLRVAMQFDNGKKINQRSVFNLFHYWFGKHYILNETCLDCRYRTLHRFSDITIGDFWGVQNVLSGTDTTKGVSAVIINTSAGKNILESLDATSIKVDIDKAVKYLKGLVEKRPYDLRMKEAENMHNFSGFYLSHDFEEVRAAYAPPTQMSFFIDRIKSLLHIR
ncbi:MAG: 4Fe-4S dicluster domain-containing protein [Bacteroidales bacterium]|nr:4Fe-4S dicluster domain-containing protein [Bacteroidales bacterium]